MTRTGSAARDAVEVEKLIEFALRPRRRHGGCREWWGMRLRRRLGPGRSLLFFPFLATGAAHRLRVPYGHWSLQPARPLTRCRRRLWAQAAEDEKRWSRR